MVILRVISLHGEPGEFASTRSQARDTGPHSSCCKRVTFSVSDGDGRRFRQGLTILPCGPIRYGRDAVCMLYRTGGRIATGSITESREKLSQVLKYKIAEKRI